MICFLMECNISQPKLLISLILFTSTESLFFKIYNPVCIHSKVINFNPWIISTRPWPTSHFFLHVWQLLVTGHKLQIVTSKLMDKMNSTVCCGVLFRPLNNKELGFSMCAREESEVQLAVGQPPSVGFGLHLCLILVFYNILQSTWT